MAAVLDRRGHVQVVFGQSRDRRVLCERPANVFQEDGIAHGRMGRLDHAPGAEVLVHVPVVVHEPQLDDVRVTGQGPGHVCGTHPLGKPRERFGVEPDLHDSRLVDAGDARILEVLALLALLAGQRARGALHGSLDDLSALLRQQRHKVACLIVGAHLFGKGPVKAEVRPQIRVPALVRDPDFVKDRFVHKVAQALDNLLGREVRFVLGHVHQVRQGRGLHDHLFAHEVLRAILQVERKDGGGAQEVFDRDRLPLADVEHHLPPTTGHEKEVDAQRNRDHAQKREEQLESKCHGESSMRSALCRNDGTPGASSNQGGA